MKVEPDLNLLVGLLVTLGLVVADGYLTMKIHQRVGDERFLQWEANGILIGR